MYLQGVGPRRKEILGKELGITTWRDLLEYYPYKYVDRSKVYHICDLRGDMPFVQVMGRILSFEEFPMQARKVRIVAHVSDGTGVCDIVWFNGSKYIYDNYKVGERYVIFGKPAPYGGRYQFSHPEMDKADGLQLSEMGMQPHYVTTDKMKKTGLMSNAIGKLQTILASKLPSPMPETLPPDMTSRLHLASRDEALRLIHHPKTLTDVQRATLRLKFEELFYVQLNILRYANDNRRKYRGYVFQKVGPLFNDFYSRHLPFELTDAQKRVMREIRADMKTGRQMNRLLQGDVGSGKTLVALMTMLIALDNGFQACMMAPTEILAEQHFATIRQFLGDMSVRVELLTGTVKGKRRREVLEKLATGEVDILVGTHAIIEDPVTFSRLGAAIVDEQHRFGVDQRAKLWSKNTLPPHVLVMTATPIPRTLAMTVYGDLDVSVIDEMPPGRKPVRTTLHTPNRMPAVYKFMREEIAKGRQVFVVYPMIYENEKLDIQNLELGYDEIVKAFPFPPYKCAIVHGQQTSEVKNFNMEAFAAGRANILVSTTVIEVGVDVPNASVMVIMSAERFGLSQLHQLRGRVGRGAASSHCILIRDYKCSKEAIQRLELMCSTENGFEIAEEDMKMRGPGDLEGTQQSGLPISLNIASLAKDGQILSEARAYAQKVLDEDPTLDSPKNARLLHELRKEKYQIKDYSRIS